MFGTPTAIIKHVWRGTDPMRNQKSGNKFSRVSAVLIPLCTSPVALLLRRDPGKALAAWVCTTALVMSIRFFWNRRRHLWFWVTVTILAALHVLLILYVPWPGMDTPIGGPALVPFALLDVGIVCGCFRLVEKLFSRNARASSTS